MSDGIIVISLLLISVSISISLILFGYSYFGSNKLSNSSLNGVSNLQKILDKYYTKKEMFETVINITDFTEPPKFEVTDETKKLIDELYNDMLDLIPEKYKSSFNKCERYEQLYDFSSNYFCFLKEYKDNLNKDTYSALTLLYLSIQMARLKKYTKKEDLKQLLSYNSSTNLINITDMLVKKLIINSVDDIKYINIDTIDLDDFINATINTYENSGNFMRCKFCGQE